MNTKLVGAGVVAILVSAAIVIWTKYKDEGCVLTGAGATILLEGVTRGHDARTIGIALGTTAATTACMRAVDELKTNPSEPVEITITHTGDTLTTSGDQLNNTVFEVGDPACYGWKDEILRDWCLQGKLFAPN